MTRKKKEQSVEEKLSSLYMLQLIDSRIDSIRNVRGELPLEVQDLEDEIEGFNARLAKLQAMIEEKEADITAKNNTIAEAKTLIKKYGEQQNNVRNNREYDALSKEIEFQDLEIQLAEKRIREAQAEIAEKSQLLETTKEALVGKTEAIDNKRQELDSLSKETESEENILLELSEKVAQDVEDRLLNAYRRIRKSSINGLAVVTIEREASQGSQIVIPPQRQLEVANRTKIMIDEHSGRILVDNELATKMGEKVEKMISKALK